MSVYLAFFSIVSALLLGAMSPGPSFVLVSRTAIAGSRAQGVASALGMGAGGVIFVALALGGLTALLLQAEWLFHVLKFCGGLYLVYLGICIVRGATQSLGEGSCPRSGADGVGRAFRTALLVQLSNPKTIIVYGSIFAALLPPPPPLWLLIVLPPTIFVVEAGWYLLVALVFSASRPRAAYIGAKAWIDRMAGAFLAALGLRLAFDGIATRFS